jgi:EpsI family protein
MTPSVQYVTAVVLLVGLAGGMRHYDRAENLPARKQFASFPFELGSRVGDEGTQWRGREQPLEKDVLETLRVDDYMMRQYTPAPHAALPGTSSPSRAAGANDFSAAGDPLHAPHVPLWLYVGYYKSQRTGVTYHSPLNCLPGSGWSIMSREVIPLALTHGGQGQLLASASRIRVNKVVIQKGLEKQLILYWYQDRGRVVTSEYWAKGYLLWDAMTRNRTDGALVRLSIPVESTTEEALASGESFLRDAYPLLAEYLPV